MAIGDDLPHPVPPQARMTWKENWAFCAIDQSSRFASVFHISLRPGLGVGIFSAHVRFTGDDFSSVGRATIPMSRPLHEPITDGRTTLEIAEAGDEFRITHAGERISLDLTYSGRFPVFDFDELPRAEGSSVLGEIGLGVLPFRHQEQAMLAEGVVTLVDSRGRGERHSVTAMANRDHSWGWRDDLSFLRHEWLCASFPDRYVGAMLVDEEHYRAGPKIGAWASSREKNTILKEFEVLDAYWDAGAALPDLDHDVRIRLVSSHGTEILRAHLSDAVARFPLHATSRDRTRVYEDVEVFCEFTVEGTGERGAGLLEIGKLLLL
jgi:hypothetical protein